MTQSFCKKCKLWFPKREACPDCGYDGYGFNKWLRTAQLNAHLYGQANAAVKERTDQDKFVKAARNEAKRVSA